MLDTNTASYILNNKSPVARTRISSLQKSETVCISVITEAELIFGVEKLDLGGKRRRLLDWFLSLVSVPAWGREEAAVYGKLRARQEALGKALSPLDTQIAAHAIAIGAHIVSHDNAFKSVLHLAVVDWATDL
jgi:tRNA(fMet)-specific endonuclease VapC